MTMLGKVTLSALGITILMSQTALAAGTTQIRAGFNPYLATFYFGAPVKGTFKCPATPTVVSDLGNMRTMYDRKDPTQSHVDPARVAAGNAQRDADLLTFTNTVDQLSMRYVMSKPADKAIAVCTMGMLATAASKDGLLLGLTVFDDEVDRHQMFLTQAFHLGALSSAFLKTAAGTPWQQRVTVTPWLQKLALSVMKEYSGSTKTNQWLRLGGNHLTWSGFAVATTGAALQNRKDMLDFGMMALDRALLDISADGSMKTDITRGTKALVYHNFHLVPISGLVRIADANGIKLTDQQEISLQKAVKFVMSQDKDPNMTIATKLAKTKLMPINPKNDLAWADIILPHLKKTAPDLAAELDAMVKPLRPFYQVYAGGELTNTYNPERDAQ